MALMKSVLIFIVIWQTHQTLSKLSDEGDQFQKLTEQVGILMSDSTRLRVKNIAVVSDSRATISWTPKSFEQISLLNLYSVNPRKPFISNMPWHERFHTFIIITSSAENLKYLIEGLRNSTLWNPAALYVLLDNQTVQNGCESANRFLKIAWNNDLVSSTYFCVDPPNEFMVYTYNPFTDWAPKTWIEVHSDYDFDRHHMSALFEMKLIPGNTTYHDIMFDKTRTLNGYPLNVLGLHLPPLLFVNSSKTGFDMLSGIDADILCTIFKKWDVVLNATVYKPRSGFYSYLENITLGQYDLLMNRQYIFNKPHMKMAYPHVSTGLRFVTRFPGYEDGYKKILSFIGSIFLTAILLIFVGTGVILAKCTGQGLSSACLEVLRIMLGVSMRHFPKDRLLRIYLVTILMFFIITAATFQSNLSSLLTTPTLKSSMNSVEDLHLYKVPIYIYEGYRGALYNDTISSQIRPYDHWDCSTLVENLGNVACVGDATLMFKIAYEKNLHVSKKNIVSLYVAYMVRPNWPLIEKFSLMLMVLNEGGFINLAWDNSINHYKVKLHKLEAASTSKNYQVLTLSHMSFAFYILLFGYVISMAVFVGEVLTNRHRKQKMREKTARNAILPFVH